MTQNKLAAKIEKHLQNWANILNISDYKFTIKFANNAEIDGDYANVDTEEHTREVVMTFNRHRLNKEPHEIERTVVHELLHVRFNEYAEHLEDVLKEYGDSPKVKRILRSKADKLEHKIIVALTEALIKETK